MASGRTAPTARIPLGRPSRHESVAVADLLYVYRLRPGTWDHPISVRRRSSSRRKRRRRPSNVCLGAEPLGRMVPTRTHTRPSGYHLRRESSRFSEIARITSSAIGTISRRCCMGVSCRRPAGEQQADRLSRSSSHRCSSPRVEPSTAPPWRSIMKASTGGVHTACSMRLSSLYAAIPPEPPPSNWSQQSWSKRWSIATSAIRPGPSV